VRESREEDAKKNLDSFQSQILLDKGNDLIATASTSAQGVGVKLNARVRKKRNREGARGKVEKGGKKKNEGVGDSEGKAKEGKDAGEETIGSNCLVTLCAYDG